MNEGYALHKKMALCFTPCAFVVVGIRNPTKAYAEVVGNLNSISAWAGFRRGRWTVDCLFIVVLGGHFGLKNYFE